MLVLATWPDHMAVGLWIHFINNVAAQSALVIGSTTVASGDIMVGMAWEVIAKRCIYPWFDRVDSASNPVDGLSRGDRQGPWSTVTKAQVPRELLRRLRYMQFH